MKLPANAFTQAIRAAAVLFAAVELGHSGSATMNIVDDTNGATAQV